MTDLVSIQNNKVIVSSRQVAENFGGKAKEIYTQRTFPLSGFMK